MEIAELFNKFINVYEENQIPNCITILSTVVPIIISIILLWQNNIIAKRNEELQRDIAKNNEKLQKDLLNNEIKIKSYDIILNVYTTFIDALADIPSTEDGLNSMLKNHSRNYSLILNIINQRDKMTIEVNKIKLLLKDDKIILQKILELQKIYKDIANEIVEIYLEHKNKEITVILENIHKYKELLEYDNYDKYFEKYLTFVEMK